MMWNLYKSEIKKQFSPKTAIILLIILVLGFVVMAVAFDALSSLQAGLTDPDSEFQVELEEIEGLEGAFDFAYNFSKEEVTSLIIQNKLFLEEQLADKKENGYRYYTSADEIYATKASIRALEYMQEHELYDKDIYFYFGSSTMAALGMFDQTAQNFSSAMIVILGSLAILYGLIVGSGAYATEMKNGTLKLVFLRPITRNQLTTAKLLASLTLAVSALMATVLLVVIYAFIRYPSDLRTVLYVFNAESAFLGTSAGGVASAFFGALISVVVNTVIAFSVGTLTKNRVVGLVVPIGCEVAAFAMQYACLGRFWITDVMNLDQFFAVNTASYGGANFGIALPLLLVYVVGLITATYLVFNKRDIA